MNSSLPQKIGFVAYSLEPGLGGIPRVARLIERTLEEFVELGVPYQRLTLSQFGSGKSRLARLVATIRVVKAHRRLAQSCSHFVYDSCQMAQLHCKPWLLKAPALTFIHGIEVWDRAKPRWINACHCSRILTANSDFTRRRAEALHGNFLRARVSWLATEHEEAPISDTKPTEPTVLIVSRIDSGEGYKGHLELVDAWPRILQSVPNAKLRIIGRGSGLLSLKQRVAQIKCENNIIFEGFVHEDELEDCYRSSSVFAMPSRGEGFGIVYIEAMRCGLPVIVSKHDAGQEVIVDGQTGYAADLDAPDELANRLIDLLQNPLRAQAMGQAGQERWRQHFTPSRFVQRFRPAIDDLLALSASESTSASPAAERFN